MTSFPEVYHESIPIREESPIKARQRIQARDARVLRLSGGRCPCGARAVHVIANADPESERPEDYDILCGDCLMLRRGQEPTYTTVHSPERTQRMRAWSLPGGNRKRTRRNPLPKKRNYRA